MSLTFTALPVPEGDAFLLEDGDRKYLFDSGGNQDRITKLLKAKNIDKIDVAICSHNDSDHSHGFIGLLKMQRNPIVIDEIWLPELWCAIVTYAITNRNNKELWSAINKSLLDNYEDENSEKWNDYDINKLFDEEFKYSLQNQNLLSNITEIDLSYQKNNPQPCAFIMFLRTCSTKSVVDKLNNIIRIVSLALQNGCKILWFRNTKYCHLVHNHHGFIPNFYGFVPLNSMPAFITCSGINYIFWYPLPIIKLPTTFIHATALSAVNHFSLVFEYHRIKEKPVVRFSADSDCDFQTYNPYKDNIIITAAHHGSDTNHAVFKGIKGCDITWVRTYHRKVIFCFSEFLKRSNRYCIKCPSKVRLNEIKFEYKSGKWQPKSGILCKCK